MVLKLLQTQEIERIVNYKCERDDLKYVITNSDSVFNLTSLSFFHYCRAHSRIGPQSDSSDSEGPQNPQDDLSEEDECAPPPIIKRRREEPIQQDFSTSAQQDPQQPRSVSFPPEVDELGIPTTDLPTEPITNFSWRNFYSSINYLRILQKVCKNKAHRNLMLITYKSAQHLKKSLKVPQPSLRLYTLKLFKNQVPYCGRKWRQSNMRVITAVYLHCRPELRDDWLSGSDVDGDVEMSVPLEQSLRALTHWYNLRRWPEKMGALPGVLKEEQDFFLRELERLDWGDLNLGEEMRDEEGGPWDGVQSGGMLGSFGFEVGGNGGGNGSGNFIQ
jgi:hypothetical protein